MGRDTFSILLLMWSLRGLVMQEEVKLKEDSTSESKSKWVLIENKEENYNEKKAVGKKKSLRMCLVGSWDTGLVRKPELRCLENGEHVWNLRKLLGI
ncbi:hypothetical protein AAG906_013832 [Vitis piasezkii]